MLIDDYSDYIGPRFKVDRNLPPRRGSLGHAELIARDAHCKQVDKLGKPYIYHVEAVAALTRSIGNDDQVIAAWLHDVVEDTEWTLRGLRNEGFGERVVELVDHLTRRPNEQYHQYLLRLTKDKEATDIKLADHAVNTFYPRMEALGDTAYESLRYRYQNAAGILTSAWQLHNRGLVV